MDYFNLYNSCTLCPRACHANRTEFGQGFCGETSSLRVARAGLHFWEEPSISGDSGSGAIFFSGCSLRCVYCQNNSISHCGYGVEVTADRLSKMMLELQQNGANNINLVTAGHYVPHVLSALDAAKKSGLSIPVVYNSSGYESVSALKLLDGYIDVYLPDYKYFSEQTAAELSSARDYPTVAAAAFNEMFRQVGTPVFNSKGILIRGMIARHLVLPMHTHEAIRVIDYLFESFGNSILYSIMSQYTPPENELACQPLNRRLTKVEYNRVVDHCISIGIENGYFQNINSSAKNFTPEFDGTGVLYKRTHP